MNTKRNKKSSALCNNTYIIMGKECAYYAGDPGNTDLSHVSGRSPGGGNGNPLQYSCLENSMDRGAWWDTVHGVAESGMPERLTHYIFMLCIFMLHFRQYICGFPGLATCILGNYYMIFMITVP